MNTHIVLLCDTITDPCFTTNSLGSRQVHSPAQASSRLYTKSLKVHENNLGP